MTALGCTLAISVVATVKMDSELWLGEALLLFGICKEDISRGANMSEGLGDWPTASSPTLLLFLPALEDGACREAEEKADEEEAGTSWDTTLASSSASLDVLESITSWL
jgi:hypothetical protein